MKRRNYRRKKMPLRSYFNSSPSLVVSKRQGQKRLCGVVMSVAILAMAACVEAPSKVAAPVMAPTSLQEYMQQASREATDGFQEKARESYRNAARDYPASKEPWSKLSSDYFAAGDYGNAILAAQEVLSRDANDTVAASVLAVGALRISGSALQALRAQNRIAGDARSEAEAMTKTLRTVLGEELIAPRSSGTAQASRQRSRQGSSSVNKLNSASAATSTATATPTPGNPFDKLK